MNPSGHPVSPQLHFARVRLGYTRLVRTGGSRLRSIGGARRRHVQSQVPRPATDRTVSGPSAPRPGRPSPLPDDHPRFGESGEQQNAEETEHQRRHTSAQNRVGSVGLVNVDVACDPLAIDDAGPVGSRPFKILGSTPQVNPASRSRSRTISGWWVQISGIFPSSTAGHDRAETCTCALPKQSITSS